MIETTKLPSKTTGQKNQHEGKNTLKYLQSVYHLQFLQLYMYI